MTEDVRHRLWNRIRTWLPTSVKAPVETPDEKSGLWKVIESAFEIGKHEADLKICALEMKLEHEQELVKSLEGVVEATAHLRGHA